MNAAKNNPKRHVLGAWLVGGFIYMFLAMDVVADAGFIAIPFQLIMGAVFSIAFVGAAYLFGLLLLIPVLLRFWYSTAIPPLVLLALSAMMLLFGRSFGITHIVVLSDNHMTYQALHPIAAFGALLASVFAVLHFPPPKPSSHEPVA
jgi:hypothetical protein